MIARPTTQLQTSGPISVEQIDVILCGLNIERDMELINWWLDVRLDLAAKLKEQKGI
jgi:hypothetical protein